MRNGVAIGGPEVEHLLPGDLERDGKLGQAGA